MRANLNKVAVRVLLGAAAFSASTMAYAQSEDMRQAFPQVETTTPTGVNLQTGQYTDRGVDMQFGPFTVDHLYRNVYYKGPSIEANKPARTLTSLRGHTFKYCELSECRQLVQLGETLLRFNWTASGDLFRWIPQMSAGK